jgi:hypothetical protein
VKVHLKDFTGATISKISQSITINSLVPTLTLTSATVNGKAGYQIDYSMTVTAPVVDEACPVFSKNS